MCEEIGSLEQKYHNDILLRYSVIPTRYLGGIAGICILWFERAVKI